MHFKMRGQGPPLLFLPGLDGTGELFYRQADELVAHFTVVTAALRDQGEFTYQDLIDDIARLITKLERGPVVLCGESFGGTLALQFTLAHPELVARLVVINSFPYFGNRPLLRLGQLLLEFTPYELIHWGRAIAANLRLLAEDLPSEDRKKFIAFTSTLPKFAIMRRMALVAEHDVRARLTEIKTPTLFIASRRDRLQDSVAEARYMSSRIEGAKVAILEGMGHIPLPSPACSLLKIFRKAAFMNHSETEI